MDTLHNRAETQKIARLLDVDPRRLEFLRTLPADDVREFRRRAVDALFDNAPEMLDRIASATKLVPAGVAAAISQKALGPRLAASVAGRLEPSRAADIIERLPVAFTAQACAHIDPRRIEGIVDRLDEDLVVRIAVALAEAGDHPTMGRFVGHLRDSALERVLDLVDDTVVLRVGFLIDMPERLYPIMELMGGERLASIVRTAGEGGAADGAVDGALGGAVGGAELWPGRIPAARTGAAFGVAQGRGGRGGRSEGRGPGRDGAGDREAGPVRRGPPARRDHGRRGEGADLRPAVVPGAGRGPGVGVARRPPPEGLKWNWTSLRT